MWSGILWVGLGEVKLDGVGWSSVMWGGGIMWSLAEFCGVG